MVLGYFGVLQRDALSLIGEVILSSRLLIAMTFKLGDESHVSLLPSNSASIGHLDVVSDKLGEECLWVFLWFEIGDVFVERDFGV